jgi:hypothetical protein
MEILIMNAQIIRDTDDNNVPYLELKIEPSDPRDPLFFITFRKYPKRVFVGVEDYRLDQSSGADLEDCWLAPVVIVEKTERNLFDPFKAFIHALTYLGEIERPTDPNERDFDYDMWTEEYSTIESTISEWSNG